jgi:hypothetical protein
MKHSMRYAFQTVAVVFAVTGCDGALSVDGQIVDTSGAPISSARVQTYPNDARSYVSDSNGCFRFFQMCAPFARSLPLRVTADGYQGITGTVDPSGANHVRVTLERQGAPAAGRIQKTDVPGICRRTAPAAASSGNQTTIQRETTAAARLRNTDQQDR